MTNAVPTPDSPDYATPMEGSNSGRLARTVEVARLFTRLGFTAFGGPAAHVAMIEDEVVVRRRWLDRQHFLDLVACVNFIPGPNSTELAIHLGLLRAGFAGLTVAGFCFIVPAVLIIQPLAWLYVRYGAVPDVQPALRGIGAAVVAIVAVVTSRLMRTTMTKTSAIVLACIAFALSSFASAQIAPRAIRLQPELIALAIAAVWGCATAARKPNAAPPLAIMPFVLAPASVGGFGAMAVFFLKVGATLFGSGYVLVSYLQSGLVDERHWLTQRQLLDAIAVGQFTPGPLLTTATFIGYLLGAGRFGGGIRGGIFGALLATVAIFAPSFFFVAALGPLLQRIRHHPAARSALDSMNAAVTGLLAAVAVHLAWTALHEGNHISWVNSAIIAMAMIALLNGVNATWLIIAGGAIGWAASVLG